MRHVLHASLLLVLGCNGGDKDTDLTDADTDTDTDADSDSDADTDSDSDADTDADTDTDTDTDPAQVVDCQASLPTPPAGETCTVTGDPATATHVLLQGDVLGDVTAYLGGDVLYARGDNGLITCVGCSCAAQAPADTLTVSCPDAVVSPGLVNAHDHITYTLQHPGDWGTERFDHRHDWRTGARGHSDLPYDSSDSSDEAVLVGELRMLLGGATSISGSGSAPGLLRNLDVAADNEGLGSWEVNYETFPLGDSDGTMAASGCDQYFMDGEFVLDDRVYEPHIAEGIDDEAQNEFACLSGTAPGGVDLVADNTSIIHGVGLDANDVAEVSTSGAQLVWSPRSNVALYGETAPVTLYDHLGVPIALGTDWTISGSATVLRELQCADSLNQNHYGGHFSDRELWLMVTRNGSVALGADGQLGRLRPGFVADLAVFAKDGNELHRAVIDAGLDDVELVIRGSEPLTGDADLLGAILPAADYAACEALDDCVADHVVCVDGAASLASILAATSGDDPYDLTICDVPADEPTCEPLRQDEDGDGLIYPTSSPTDGDGDGVDDAQDNCPNVFNPGKPLDGFVQGDADGDGQGDACDRCPTDVGGGCNWTDPDGDGVDGLDDNCPADANVNQDDGDNDFLGDACDPCPTYASISGACPGSVYDVKQGLVASGDPVVLEHLIVTGGQDRGVFAQLDPDHASFTGVDFSGIFVYMPTIEPKPQRGDVITVEGAVTEFFGQWQLGDVVSVTTEDTGRAEPAAVVADPVDVATGGSRADALEGVLVQVEDVTVVSVDVPPGPGDSAPTNEFEVDDGLLVNDYLYLVTPFPVQGEDLAGVRGVLRWANDASKIEPRDALDVLSGPASLDTFTPTQTFVEVAQTSSALLSLSLTRPAGQREVVSLVCAPAAALTCPPNVVFQVGEQVVPVELTGVARSVNATVTATLGSSSVVADVVVYDDLMPRRVVALSPDPLVVNPSDVAPMTVTLNLPGASTGTVVDLDTTVGLATVPATVRVPRGSLDADFAVTAGGGAGQDLVTASLGPSSAQAVVDIQAGVVGTGLIISEYLEGSSGNNKYVEIENIDSVDVDLTGCTVKIYSNGAVAAGTTINLSAVTIPSHDRFLLCHSSASFVTGAPCDQSSGSLTFNGDDAVELACGATVHDVIGQIGFDPGTTWGAAPLATADAVIRRDCSVAIGDDAGADVFDPAVEWVAGTMDDASNLGLPHCP